MSELRQDPLTGRWVIIAEGREARPDEFRRAGREPREDLVCPFCPGHEHLTTAEVAARGRPRGDGAGTPGWRVRAFANLYPAVIPATTSPDPAATPGPAATPDPAATPGSRGETAADRDLFVTRPGHGRHEIVVCSPRHEDHLAALGVAQLTEVLLMVRDRSRALARDDGMRYVLPFANHGPAAGATLAHPHLQLIALTEVPDVVRAKLRAGLDYRRRTGRCLICDLADRETRLGRRVISAGDGWLVWAPWASRSPWEMIATCRRHVADFRDLTAADLRAGAEVLDGALGALDRLFGDPPLNLVFHSAPLAPYDRRDEDAVPEDAAPDDVDREQDGASRLAAAFHWHLEILPRLAGLAGFEVGTGFAINSVAPETAARRLREEGSPS